MSAVTMRWQDIKSFATSDERLLEHNWHVALIGGTHRDSSILDKSNALDIEERLLALDEDMTRWGWMRASHWACGWYDHLIIDPEWQEGIALLEDIRSELDNYPVLNEDRFSGMEVDAHLEGRCDEHCNLTHRCEDCNRERCICAQED